MKISAQSFTKLIQEVLLKKPTSVLKDPKRRPTKAELEKKWRLERVKPE